MEDPEQIQTAVDAAVALYVEHGRPASLDHIAERTGLDVAELHDEFGTVDGPLVRWFANLVPRCEALVAELAPATVEDRLGAFAFVMLDLLEEEPEFVSMAFDDYAALWGSAYRAALAETLPRILESGEIPAVNQFVLTAPPSSWVAVEAFVRMVQAWVDDRSDNRDRSTALIDRLVRFYAEIATNQTVSRGIDVVRYAAEAGYIPFVGDWIRGKQTEAADG